jgi:hypothetical protein
MLATELCHGQWNNFYYWAVGEVTDAWLPLLDYFAWLFQFEFE